MLVSILKVIGIILLCILAFILLLLCLILFAPFRYSISAEFDKDKNILDASVKVSWILFIKFILQYSSKKLSYKLKVFFINILNSERVKKKKSDTQTENLDDMSNEVQTESTDDISTEMQVEIQQEMQTEISPEIQTESTNDISTEISPEMQIETTNDVSSDIGIESEDDVSSEIQTDSLNDSSAENETKKKFSFTFLHPTEIFDIIFNKILDVVDGIRRSVSGIIKNIDKICKLITDPENQQFVMFALGEVKKVLKSILPKKHSIYLKLGLADPSLTGEILGAYSVIKNAFGLNFVLEPDFNQEVIEAKINLKGSIRIITLLIVAIRIYFNKTFRKLIRRKK